jgi:hypothetical protein
MNEKQYLRIPCIVGATSQYSATKLAPHKPIELKSNSTVQLMEFKAGIYKFTI